MLMVIMSPRKWISLANDSGHVHKKVSDEGKRFILSFFGEKVRRGISVRELILEKVW